MSFHTIDHWSGNGRMKNKVFHISFSLDCKEGHMKKNSLCVCVRVKRTSRLKEHMLRTSIHVGFFELSIKVCYRLSMALNPKLKSDFWSDWPLVSKNWPMRNEIFYFRSFWTFPSSEGSFLWKKWVRLLVCVLVKKDTPEWWFKGQKRDRWVIWQRSKRHGCGMADESSCSY